MCGGDSWEVGFYHQEERRSRKDRWCQECATEIKKGERYVRCTALVDHSVSSDDMCLRCVRVEKAYFKAEHAVGHSDASYTRRGLRETITECISEEPHFVVAFRAAWKGEPVPKAPPPKSTRTYSSVLV